MGIWWRRIGAKVGRVTADAIEAPSVWLIGCAVGLYVAYRLARWAFGL
jgi:hypothetical protein